MISPDLERIRRDGLRLTRQRRMVLTILEESRAHLDAEAVYSLAKIRDPRISLATVYRSLALLKSLGLAQEHRLGENHTHYELAPSSPHYHFTCQSCGRVVEFDAPLVMEAARLLCEREDLQISEIHLHISGLCADCRKS